MVERHHLVTFGGSELVIKLLRWPFPALAGYTDIGPRVGQVAFTIYLLVNKVALTGNIVIQLTHSPYTRSRGSADTRWH